VRSRRAPESRASVRLGGALVVVVIVVVAVPRPPPREERAAAEDAHGEVVSAAADERRDQFLSSEDVAKKGPLFAAYGCPECVYMCRRE